MSGSQSKPTMSGSQSKPTGFIRTHGRADGPVYYAQLPAAGRHPSPTPTGKGVAKTLPSPRWLHHAGAS